MGRKRIYIKYNHPYSFVRVIEAIMADYTRRERTVAFSSEADDVIAEYQRINKIIDDAVTMVEPELAVVILHDVINHIGYERSRAVVFAAKRTYYRRKAKLIHDIGAALHYT